jgi:hypothetical protein
MIYFLHDRTSRAIKIGCARDIGRRMAALQTSTPNELVLLGAIAGTERTEKKVHALVLRHCGPKPGEPFTRPLCLLGEWFDDRILPFVQELIASPKKYLGDDKKQSAERPAAKDPSVHQGKMVLVFDSGEQYQENYVFKAASPDLALAALATVANARLSFLANTVRITRLSVPGRPAKTVSLQGAFVTRNCPPREGLSLIVNSEPGNGYATLGGVKQYSNRWLHGVPGELRQADRPWRDRPTAQLQSLLQLFARALNENQCVISAQTPLAVRGLMARDFGPLPKGELRSKANRRVASLKRRQRSPEQPGRVVVGIVYFIQDAVALAVKIGFCLRNPEKRLAALQIGNANRLRLLGRAAGSQSHEKALHMRFSQFRVQGEWFSAGILADVEVIVKCGTIEEWLRAREPAQPEQPLHAGEVGPG